MAENDWYVGHIQRMDAEKQLLNPLNGHGSFLIRCSESRLNCFSLSLRDGHTVKHYLIRSLRSSGFTIARRNFSSLLELVDYYRKYSDGLCVNLRKPCVRASEPTMGEEATVGDSYETDRSTVKLVRVLGKGQFGNVSEGLWCDRTPVAVKSLIEGSMDPKDFLAEAQVMKNLKHPNLIQLFAVCTLEEPIYIITELMTKGSLLQFLKGKKRNGAFLPLSGMVRIAADICRGMAYLEKENYIHRDLAARNVLMGDRDIVKIADFGLARLIKDQYMATQGTKFPIKWTAPEAISNNIFTIKSDVWSFGILLTELVTHGDIPYGEDMSNLLVMVKVEQGYRMPCPPKCPLGLYDIMMECWNAVPMKRPTFETLLWKLDEFFTLDSSDYREAAGYC